jgi:hypothetical protein
MAVTATDTEQNDTGPGSDSETGPDFARARAAGEVVKAFVAHYEAGRYSGDDSVTLLKFFTEMERTAMAGKTLAAARVARSNVHTRTGHRSPAEYIAAETGDSVGESKDTVRLGESLADQPAVDEALRRGKMSRRRAQRVSEAARINPGREEDLVKGAETDSEAEHKERCHRAKAEGRSREDAARHHRRLHENRSCRDYVDDDGAFGLRATLAPEAGAEVKACLEAQADRQYRQARAEGRVETADAYRADALYALITGKFLSGPPGPSRADTDPAHPDTPTAPAGTAPAVTPVRTPNPGAKLNVIIDLDTLRQGTVGPGGRCEISGVGPVSVAWARELLGDGLFQVFVTSATDVHSVWSPGRHQHRDVRAGLLLRDPRCVVPGCDARLGLEADHWVKDFAHGGLTTLDNLARICTRHHRQRTHQGYVLRKGPEGWEWIPPETPKVPTRPKRKRKPRTEAEPHLPIPPPGPSPPLFDPEE